MKSAQIAFIVIIVTLALSTPLFSKTLTGKVIGISDGDTITILDSIK